MTATDADDSVERISDSYDRVAAEYADKIGSELDRKPFDRAWLDAFAERVGAGGTICDAGCGPGHISEYLRARGAEVIGVDLSPAMVAQARLRGLTAQVGDLRALGLPAVSVAGILAFYSIIHIRREDLGACAAEFARVIRPGGAVLLAFHVGAEDRHLDEWWGHEVDLDFLFHDPDEVLAAFTAAGLAIERHEVRDPYPPEVEVQTPRAYVQLAAPERGSPRS